MSNLHDDASLLVYFPLENYTPVSTVGLGIHGFNSKQCNIDDSCNPKNETSTSQIKGSPDELEQIPN